MVDHSSLTSFFKQPNLNARRVWWIFFQSEFDFDIKHLKGKEKWVVDSLSRRLSCIYEITYSQTKLYIINHTKQTTQRDPDYQFLWQKMKQEGKKLLDYNINKDNLLTYRNKNYVPN